MGSPTRTGAALAIVMTVATAALMQAQTGRHTILFPVVTQNAQTGFMSGGTSGSIIQNLDPIDHAAASVEFYVHGGGRENEISLDPIPPRSARDIWVPGTTLPVGTYAARVRADRPVAGVTRTDWYAARAAAMDGHAPVSSHVNVPLVVRDYFGQCSYLVVQNADSQRPATVDFSVRASGEVTPTARTSYTVRPASAIGLDLCGDSELFSGPLLGSAEFTADRPIGVQAFVRTSDPAAVYAFGGRPAQGAADTLLVPLFRAKQFVDSDHPAAGRFDTGISVANPGASPVAVSIEYHGAEHPAVGDGCRGRTFVSPEVTIAAGSSHVFYQGTPARQNLPEGCFGSAVVHATGGSVLAVVNDSLNEGQTAAAYNAFTIEDAATRVALPLYRRNHAGGITTGISVMNAGPVRSEVSIEYTQINPDWSSAEPVVCPRHCVASLDPNRSAFFWPPSADGLEDNTFGSAIIRSTQPVVVIVNDVASDGVTDMATYSGIGVE